MSHKHVSSVIFNQACKGLGLGTYNRLVNKLNLNIRCPFSANFHLQNGAVMWRLNWAADMTVRGLNNSCGMMVNYRYYLDNTMSNSQQYIEHNVIHTSQQIQQLCTDGHNSVDSWYNATLRTFTVNNSALIGWVNIENMEKAFSSAVWIKGLNRNVVIGCVKRYDNCNI